MNDKLTEAMRDATSWRQVGDVLGISSEGVRAHRAKIPANFHDANFAAIIKNVPDDDRVEFLLYVIELMRPDQPNHVVDDMVRGLTPNERRVLICLYEAKGAARSIDQIISVCWAHKIAQDEVPSHKIIAVVICKLRKKLPDDWKIENIWGRGYRLELQSDDNKRPPLTNKEKLRAAQARSVSKKVTLPTPPWVETGDED